MPNWCSNRVSVRGPHADVETFRTFVASDRSLFDFNKVVPMPEELLNIAVPSADTATKAQNRSLYGAQDWYEWRHSNWGTKWELDPAEISVEEKRGGVVYRFYTAWGPAYGIYLFLTERFPRLTISWRYHEPNMGLRGVLNEEDAVVAVAETIRTSICFADDPKPSPLALVPKWMEATFYRVADHLRAAHAAAAIK